MKEELQSNPSQGELNTKGAVLSRIEQKRNEEEEERRRVKVSRLSMHPSNPHRGSFTVREELDFLVINKVVNSSTFHSFIVAEGLEQGCQTAFRIKQQRTKNRYLMTGIGSKSAFGLENPHFHSETLSFSSYLGQIWEFGNDKIVSSPVCDGALLEVSIDLQQGAVQWRVNGQLHAAAKIPVGMRSVPLFFFISMFNVGDEVQLFL